MRISQSLLSVLKAVAIGLCLALPAGAFAQSFFFYNANHSPDGYLRAKVGCLKGGYWVTTNWISPYSTDYFRDYVFRNNCPDRSAMTIQVQDPTRNGPYVVCKTKTYCAFQDWPQCFKISGYGTYLGCTQVRCPLHPVYPLADVSR